MVAWVELPVILKCTKIILFNSFFFVFFFTLAFILIKSTMGEQREIERNNSKRENVVPAETELMNGKNDAVMILTWDLSNKEMSRTAWSCINKWVVETSKKTEYIYYTQQCCIGFDYGYSLLRFLDHEQRAVDQMR